MTPIAFYAPMKSPDHAVPSGDRTMARLVLAALRHAGFSPELASEVRTLDLAGDAGVQRALRAESEEEADRLIALHRARSARDRPGLWFTYHCHYKAPDWLGPRVARALGIPYVVAEGSRSARRAHGAWALGHAGAEAALDAADCLLVMTPSDAEDLEPALCPGQKLVSFPPFLDASAWPQAGRRPPPNDGAVRLLTVAMMRQGDKLASFRLLAQALARVPPGAPWSLDVVGDGAARSEVESLFAAFGGRIRHHGVIHGRDRLAERYAEADLLVWPAVGEAYGMTLLEAQACGCPVLAGREGGVAAVVVDGETGILVAPRNADVFAGALAGLMRRPAELAGMGERARDFVRRGRDLPHAAAILDGALRPLLTRRAPLLAELVSRCGS